MVGGMLTDANPSRTASISCGVPSARIVRASETISSLTFISAAALVTGTPVTSVCWFILALIFAIAAASMARWLVVRWRRRKFLSATNS